VSRTSFSRVRAWVREFFVLEQAQRQSSRLTESQRRSIRAYYDAALRRLSVAGDLRGPDQTYAALSLYRLAGLFLTFAFLISKEDSIDIASLTPNSAVAKLERALEIEQRSAPADFASVKPLLVASDLLALDSLTKEEASRRAEELDTTTRWLSTLVDPRSPLRLKLTRAVRLAAATLGAATLTVWLAIRVFTPPNLALNKLARSSSTDFGTAPVGAVDGEKNGRFGLHTHEEDRPWLIIDLGRSYRIGTVKVFGRGDCCYEQSIPLALEISDDGLSFRKLAERLEPFSESDPWVLVPGSPPAARFVRLQTQRHSELVVSEVEVYEGRGK
jgi:hypothetical protein